jgi:hypothetical protein
MKRKCLELCALFGAVCTVWSCVLCLELCALFGAVCSVWSCVHCLELCALFSPSSTCLFSLVLSDKDSTLHSPILTPLSLSHTFFSCISLVLPWEQWQHVHKNNQIFLGSWFCASFSTYVYKYPTRCNNSILVLLQDHSTCFGHSMPIIRSTITAVDSHWYNMLHWIMNFVVISTLRVVQNQAVGHITVVEFNSTTVMWPTA